MTLEELDVFLKERGIQVVGSIDSKTLFKEVLGIQEPSYQQTKQIEDSRSKITNLIQSSSEKLYQESSKLNYKNILSSVLGLPEESSTPPNLSLVNKEFLSKIEDLSNEITKNVEDIKNKSKKLSENIDDLNFTENKREPFNNTPENSNDNIKENKSSIPVDDTIKVTIEYPKEKPILDSKKETTENTKKSEKNDSTLNEIKNKLDRITNLLSAEKLESFATESKNSEKNRIYQNKQNDLLQSLLETNKSLLFSFNKYKQQTEDKYKQDEQDKKYSKTGDSGGLGILGLLGSLLGGTLLGPLGLVGGGLLGAGILKIFSPIKSLFGLIGRFGGKLIKLAGIFSLGAVALEAVYPLIQKVFSFITGKPVDENAKNPVTETLGMDEPGRRDNLFRAGMGYLAYRNLKKLWTDPNRSKTITDLGRKINTKQAVPFTDIKGAGRARQAVGAGVAKTYEATKDVAKSGYQKAIGIFKGSKPAVELTKAQQIAKTTAENIQRVKAAQDAKLAAQAAKLVPAISNAATATTAVKEAGMISKALSGIKSFGSGVAGKIAKMTFGTVATGVLGGLLRKIPIISGIYELYMAYKRFTEGDYKGMVLRLLSASSNLLYLLGPQMVFLQAPLSWWLDYLDESDQPKEGETFEDPDSVKDTQGTSGIKSTGNGINKAPPIPNPKSNKKENKNEKKDEKKDEEEKVPEIEIPPLKDLLTNEKLFWDSFNQVNKEEDKEEEQKEEKKDTSSELPPPRPSPLPAPRPSGTPPPASPSNIINDAGITPESVESPRNWIKLEPTPVKEPKNWVKLNPEPPKEPLSPVVVNPPAPVVQEPKESAPTQINAPTTNVINNNSTIKQTLDPIYQNRSYAPRKITARDYRQ